MNHTKIKISELVHIRKELLFHSYFGLIFLILGVVTVLTIITGGFFLGVLVDAPAS